jgi:hypothetical protein
VIRWLIVLLSFAIAGCAYHFGDQERDIPGGYRTVAVPVFKNKTMETGIEVYFTNAMIREFERSRIGSVTEQAQAQTTLEGTIDSVEYIPTSEISNSDKKNGITTKPLPEFSVLTTEYRIFVRTTLRLLRNSDKKVLWEGNFEGERSYLAPKIGKAVINTANPLYNQSARYQNIQVMAGDIMNEAHNRLTENF